MVSRMHCPSGQRLVPSCGSAVANYWEKVGALVRAGGDHARDREAALRGAFAAREPSQERTQGEPALGRERQIGGDADDDAERESQRGSEGNGGSDAHRARVYGRRAG